MVLHFQLCDRNFHYSLLADFLVMSQSVCWHVLSQWPMYVYFSISASIFRSGHIWDTPNKRFAVVLALIPCTHYAGHLLVAVTCLNINSRDKLQILPQSTFLPTAMFQWQFHTYHSACNYCSIRNYRIARRLPTPPAPTTHVHCASCDNATPVQNSENLKYFSSGSVSRESHAQRSPSGCNYN